MYVHLHRVDQPGEVSTVSIYDDGYVSFHEEDLEYSIQDLRDVLTAAEYELDNATEDRLDWWEDDEWPDETWQDMEDDVDEDY